MASSGGKGGEIQNPSSSPTSLLSSPPSALSEPGSPTQFINAGRANIEMDEIIVDPSVAPRFRVMQPPPPPPQAAAAAEGVRLTAAGVPRKKPGRKPGSTVKPKAAADTTASGSGTEAPKQRRPRKPRDPNAPPIQRKRKVPPTDAGNDGGPMDVDSAPPSVSPAPATRQPKITELASMRPGASSPSSVEPRTAAASEPPPASFAPKAHPGSMQSILNDDPPPQPKPLQQPPAPPVTTSSRPVFDPVRGNYDPVRETMITRDPYGTGPLGSPRAPTQVANRASASPSIASLVDPAPPSIVSPAPQPSSYNQAANQSQSRFQESSSMPPSPSHPPPASRVVSQPLAKPVVAEAKRPAPAPAAAPAPIKQEPKTNGSKISSFTSMSTVPADTPAAAAGAQSKKVAAVVQQERETQKNTSSNSSSPRIGSLKDALPALPAGSERSILDFGKVAPGEEMKGTSIVLHISLNGETNKYVNFMRMAEEHYGWDALHPRLAANRDRKARIAAASAALEKNGSGRESGDDINVEMGGMGNGAGVTSGADGAPAKPARKKRNWREDEYDKDDDFVDDSEMLWEEQAAASRDGFFVYSGPLIPEVEKPAVPDGPPKRGRGSRGGRGTARGRGGGPGSRGGTGTRKPRITKLEKEQRDREKAEREKAAQQSSKAGAATNSHNLLQVSATDSPANSASG
ncbi:HPC2-domain-containing protein [Thozetella sp. PMI_491]|nr:HPC2-domain-containing protein [Thozetella sp. PMI_491]